MTEIKGESYSVLPYGKLEKVGDILYLEDHGPLFSVFANNVAQPIIYLWVDYSEAHLSRWLVFPVTIDLLSSYIKAHISDLNLIKSATNKQYFTVDIQSVFEAGAISIEHKNILRVELENLPADYFPDADVFCAHCEDEQKIRDYFGI